MIVIAVNQVLMKPLTQATTSWWILGTQSEFDRKLYGENYPPRSKPPKVFLIS